MSLPVSDSQRQFWRGKVYQLLPGHATVGGGRRETSSDQRVQAAPSTLREVGHEASI